MLFRSNICPNFVEFEFYISQCTFISLIHLIVNLESIGAATRVSHRHPMRPDVGCGVADATRRGVRWATPRPGVGASFFFLLFFFFFFCFRIHVDLRRLGPICADLHRLGPITRRLALTWCQLRPIRAKSSRFVLNRFVSAEGNRPIQVDTSFE